MLIKAKAQAELELLCALEENKIVTQKALSRRLSVSVGLVNGLLKRVGHKGLIKVQAAPYKQWIYYLTPQGFLEKSKLVAEYVESSLDFFRQAREEYRNLFLRAKTCGTQQIILVGTGELAEIAKLSASEIGLEIAAFFDPEVDFDNFHDIPVLQELGTIEKNVIFVIATSHSSQDIYMDLAAKFESGRVLFPKLLHINPHWVGAGS